MNEKLKEVSMAAVITLMATARKAICPLLFVMLVLTPARGFANDTTAELATGGLIFTRSQDIEMRSEDLFISMTEIRVQYHFYNHSSRDVVTQVAFPVPDIPYGTDDFNFAIPTDDPQNILGFTTTVNNRPVAALVERKAVLDGVDKTQVLRNLGVPLVPRLGQKYDYLSQETWDQLVRLRLIQDTPRREGYIQPRWTLKTTYYWQQTFPARQEVIVVHRYLPSVGGVVPMQASDLLSEPLNLQIDKSKALNRFCIDQQFLNAMVRPPNATWEQHFLEYVLVTAANWSGAIKNFRLVVDKSSPENLVSFCGQGVRKISPTQFELRASDFTPTSNLSILFLTPAQPESAGVQNVPSGQTDVAALTCNQLWYQRNSIFKAAGYCFQSARAISIFGKAACTYKNVSDVPLSDRDRQVINIIQQAERMKHCPRK
jgi:Domain of unknown function (DUF4424)/YARHG domain